MKLKGTIRRILPMQQGVSKAGNAWEKVEFVVEGTGEQYPDTLCISAMNDHIPSLMGMSAGDVVDVEFACRCNEYNDKVYNSLNLVSITKEGAPQRQQQPPQQVQGDDGLPF